MAQEIGEVYISWRRLLNYINLNIKDAQQTQLDFKPFHFGFHIGFFK